MRMRKKKHAERRLAACARYLYQGEDLRASGLRAPLGAPEDAPVYLEVGAGKGGFAIGMLRCHPGVCYYAVERVTDCLVTAAERAVREEASSDACRHLRFMNVSADALPELLPEESVDCVFLNFSDPWPKKGYAKRRLTYRRYLAIYFHLLRDGGTLCFKTDNEPLFDFSLSELASLGISPQVVTRDLHASPYAEGNVMTEYETAFVAAGKPIYMLRVVKPDGFLPPVESARRPAVPDGEGEGAYAAPFARQGETD